MPLLDGRRGGPGSFLSHIITPRRVSQVDDDEPEICDGYAEVQSSTSSGNDDDDDSDTGTMAAVVVVVLLLAAGAAYFVYYYVLKVSAYTKPDAIESFP